MNKPAPLPVFTSLDVLLHDLQQNGVTDVAGERVVSFYDFKPTPPPAPKQPAPAAKVVPFNQLENKEKLVQVAEKVSEIMAAKPVVEGNITRLAALVPANEGGVFSKKEKELWGNMLNAIGLKPEEVGFIILPTSSGEMTNSVREILAQNGTQKCLLLGQQAAKALLGEEATLISARKKPYDIENTPVFTTYHPTTLLAQPMLKKLAWQDLQAFCAAKEGQK